jgi:glutamine synthetase
LNTIVAEKIGQLADELEKAKGGDFHRSLTDTLRTWVKKHKKVFFSGNNYAEDWHAEAAKRGLPNLKDTVECLQAAGKEPYVAVFERHKVLSKIEYEARTEIGWERYVKVLNIEGNATLDIARNQLLPAALAYQTKVAHAIGALKSVGVEPPGAEMELLKSVAEGAGSLKTAIDALDGALTKASSAEPHHQGETFRDLVIPAMTAVRKIADTLEEVVHDDLWPLPKYREMLFQY